MKKEIGPAVIVAVVVVMVAGLGYFLYKSMQPAYYTPSPGAGGRPNTGVPEYAKNPNDTGKASSIAAPSGSKTPVAPPTGSRAGDPGSLPH